jgi:hypothetical protein
MKKRRFNKHVWIYKKLRGFKKKAMAILSPHIGKSINEFKASDAEVKLLNLLRALDR